MGEREISVCFTGHRALFHDAVWLSGAIDTALEELYQKGCRRFLAGGALGFDTLAARRVLALRDRHEGVSLILVLPCRGQELRWNTTCRTEYDYILSMADETIYLRDSYEKGCMHERNRYLADHSAICLCYLTKLHGGTYYTVQYAKKQGLSVMNLVGGGEELS